MYLTDSKNPNKNLEAAQLDRLRLEEIVGTHYSLPNFMAI